MALTALQPVLMYTINTVWYLIILANYISIVFLFYDFIFVEF